MHDNDAARQLFLSRRACVAVREPLYRAVERTVTDIGQKGWAKLATHKLDGAAKNALDIAEGYFVPMSATPSTLPGKVGTALWRGTDEILHQKNKSNGKK